MRRTGDLEVARAERELSEERLAEVAPIARTLHEMRQDNHIRPMLRRLIQESDPKEQR
jgi:hypothetical protein